MVIGCKVFSGPLIVASTSGTRRLARIVPWALVRSRLEGRRHAMPRGGSRWNDGVVLVRSRPRRKNRRAGISGPQFFGPRLQRVQARSSASLLPSVDVAYPDERHVLVFPCGESRVVGKSKGDAVKLVRPLVEFRAFVNDADSDQRRL